jgi:carbon monoxide dehydrogenase subunit G
MLIESEFEVGAPVDSVWNYFSDVPSLVPCLPGAELTEVLGEDSYRGRVTSKVGPISLKFGGTAEVTERDPAGKKIVIAATGAEAKVKVRQDLQLTGAVAQFGRGMVTDVMTVIMGSFASAVEENIRRVERGESPLAAAKSVGGIGVGIRAATLALKRVFGRLLGIRSWYE